MFGVFFNLLFIITITGWISKHAHAATVDILSKWPQNFSGKFSIKVEKEFLNGWTLTLSFDEPIARLDVSKRKL